MSNILKPNTSINDLVKSLSLSSLKIVKLKDSLKDSLVPEEQLMFYELYEIVNRHFVSDDPDIGKLYSDEEINATKLLVVK